MSGVGQGVGVGAAVYQDRDAADGPVAGAGGLKGWGGFLEHAAQDGAGGDAAHAVVGGYALGQQRPVGEQGGFDQHRLAYGQPGGHYGVGIQRHFYR